MREPDRQKVIYAASHGGGDAGVKSRQCKWSRGRCGRSAWKKTRSVDEVADQVVSHVAEVIRGDDRVGKLLERVGVHLLDALDQVHNASRRRAVTVA